jgi:hypothetical protein
VWTPYAEHRPSTVPTVGGVATTDLPDLAWFVRGGYYRNSTDSLASRSLASVPSAAACRAYLAGVSVPLLSVPFISSGDITRGGVVRVIFCQVTK